MDCFHCNTSTFEKPKLSIAACSITPLDNYGKLAVGMGGVTPAYSKNIILKSFHGTFISMLTSLTWHRTFDIMLLVSTGHFVSTLPEYLQLGSIIDAITNFAM